MRSSVLDRLAKQPTRSLRFENLERRELLAGNVCAAVTNGNLCITGDSCANNIWVHQLCDGRWEIKGNCGTTINGQSCWTTCNVCSIKCDLGCGCDIVKISDGCLKGCITVCEAKAWDCSVCVTCCTLGGLKVTTGNGMDDVAVTHCKFNCDSTCWGKTDCNGCQWATCCVNTGCNDDCVLVEDCCGAHVKLAVDGGDGCNTNVISKCNFESIACCNGWGQGKTAVHCCTASCGIKVTCSDCRTQVSCDGNSGSWSCNTTNKCSFSAVCCDLFSSCDWSWAGCDSKSVV
jgi:hypothetical protein